MDFMLGGVSAMCAGLFSNPFDLIKTRQQLQGELEKQPKVVLRTPYGNLWTAMKSIIRAEGMLGLQKGLVPALGFQFIMNSSRLGLFETVDNLKWTYKQKKLPNGTIQQAPSLILYIFWGGVAGVVGSSLGCPMYMVKTQIQAQSHGVYAVGYQHYHKGTIDAFRTIYRQRGFLGLWHGFEAIIPRTAVGSAIQLSTFTLCKEYCRQYEIFQNSVFLTAVTSSMISGLFTCVGMTPFDVITTRMFNQGTDAKGQELLYRNVFDCFYKTFRAEGIKGLYKGAVANYWRVAPHTILNLTFWEQFKRWRALYSSEEGQVCV